MQTCRNPIFPRDENQRQVSPPLPNQIIHKIVSLVLLSCGVLWVGPSSLICWLLRWLIKSQRSLPPCMSQQVTPWPSAFVSKFNQTAAWEQALRCALPSICFGTVHVESTHEPPSELACQVSVSLRTSSFRSSGAGSLVSHHPRCFLLRAHAVQKLSHTTAGPFFCSLFHSFGVKSQDRPQKSG